jgi:hypothetical protein
MKRIILAIIVILVLTVAIRAEEGKRLWNFDADKPGSIAKGFTNEVGDWKVVVDLAAPSQPNGLAQFARNSGSTFNVTLVNDTSYKDIEVSVGMKAVAGREDQGGGLVWRARDAKNYYVVRYNPLEDNYNLYKVVQGRRSELKAVEIKHSDGWHTLMVSMKADHIECFYDGKKYIDAKDSTFKDAGKIGLWTKADAQSHFDDLTASAK